MYRTPAQLFRVLDLTQEALIDGLPVTKRYMSCLGLALSIADSNRLVTCSTKMFLCSRPNGSWTMFVPFRRSTIP